ncbi:uncharacterized protein LOC109611414 isoform X1 [Ooceraea biroi]|uniref:uncharacterized protein LOC109611414 isoform X1 n=1 Tax=Ooceraea biroi TaxID=2015173 RepID=UPI0009716855|nr:uncharacterized protein LOC109611414 isoform X1 [Ooceraea biroi]
MDFAGKRYYNIHRILLSSIGLWPYQDPRKKTIQRIISSVILISSVIVQLMKFLTTEYSLDLLLKVLSFTIPCIVFVLKYISFSIGTETVKDLMENIINDWSLLKTEDEFEIIKKHSDFGRFYTMLFTLAVYSGLSVCVVIQLAPNFLDFVAPQNESRLHHIPITAEYFVDQQKCYLPILLHIDVIAVVGFTTVMSTESLFAAFVQHAIGMFAIASYRIEHAFDEVLGINMPRKNCPYCRKIINAIYIHKRAIKFVEFLRSSFAISYIFLICLGIASLTANLFRLFLTLRCMDDLEEFIITTLFVFGHVYYIFLGNYTGQRVIDYSTDIFYKTYMSQWYNGPLHAQKLLLFIMQRSMKSTVMCLGNLFVPSLEGFATVTTYIDETMTKLNFYILFIS